MSDNNISQANGLLELAQKTHDEFVRQGEEEKERLIREGNEYYDKKVVESNHRLEELNIKVREAQTVYERSISKIRELGENIVSFAKEHEEKN